MNGKVLLFWRYHLKKCHMKRILLWFFISLLFGCEPPKMDNKSACVTFGHTKLSILNKYFRPGFPPTLVPSQGLDKDIGELLKIPLRDLGYQIKTGMGHRHNLSFFVTPLNVHYPQTRLPPTVLEAWNGYGYYKDRIIEFDNVTQLYRIYVSKYRKSWQFFESPPDGSMSYDEKWVARCLAGSLEPPNLSDVTCKTAFLYKDIHIQMTLSGTYIDLIEEFKVKIRKLFRDWETETCELRNL
jgi:hypothetical protein